MIELYTADTPNGRRVSIMLEELCLAYQIKPINLSKGEQREDWFVNINPNGKIPAIIYRSNNDITVFESGAILIYLAELGRSLLPNEPEKRFATLAWVFLQVSGVGPTQRQATIFYRNWDNRYPEVTAHYIS